MTRSCTFAIWLSGSISVSVCVRRRLTSVSSADKDSSERGRKIRTVPQARQNSAAAQPVMLLSRVSVKVGVVPGMMLMCFASLQSRWDNIVDGKLTFRFCHTEELPVTFP